MRAERVSKAVRAMATAGIMIIVVSTVTSLQGCWLAHQEPRASDPAPTRMRDGGLSGNEPASQDAAADGATPESPYCVLRELRAGTAFSPVDMVWVVDSSRSMQDEQARIRETINNFVRDVEARSFDVRLVMVTSIDLVPAPLGTDPDRHRFVARDVGSTEPLQALLDTFAAYGDFLRPSAALHFVAVTDDESQLSAQDFRAAMDTLLRRPYAMHAVASPDENGMPCRSAMPSQACLDFGATYPQICGAAAIGREYYALADQLGGQQISICVDDFQRVFGPLTEALTRVDVPCAIDFGAEQPPLSRVTLRVPDSRPTVLTPQRGAQACDASLVDGYHVAVSAARTRLTLCPQSCARANTEGAQLRIETVCAP